IFAFPLFTSSSSSQKATAALLDSSGRAAAASRRPRRTSPRGFYGRWGESSRAASSADEPLPCLLLYNTMVSRPAVLVFLLVILVVTSQFEWKQQLVNELESTTRKQQHISSREELVKDKIILSQEKMIQKLNDFIQNLQQQLLQCRGNNKTVHSSGTSLTSYISEIQRQQMMDD
ncbi:unnamed protein product, partial [Urochloa humidicola]